MSAGQLLHFDRRVLGLATCSAWGSESAGIAPGCGGVKFFSTCLHLDPRLQQQQLPGGCFCLIVDDQTPKASRITQVYFDPLLTSCSFSFYYSTQVTQSSPRSCRQGNTFPSNREKRLRSDFWTVLQSIPTFIKVLSHSPWMWFEFLFVKYFWRRKNIETKVAGTCWKPNLKANENWG